MSRKVAIGLFAAFILAGSYFLHYILPRYMAAEISGADSKRAEGIHLREATVTPTGKDVYFIYIIEDGSSAVMRNEDTGWGLPPYFKFNAADLQAKAQSVKGSANLQIGYYGWRNQLLGLFPNVLSIREAREGVPQTSWTRNIVFTVWWALIIILFPKYYSFVRGLDPGTRSSQAGSGQEASSPGLVRRLWNRMRRK